jgi:hypothetical protein
MVTDKTQKQNQGSYFGFGSNINKLHKDVWVFINIHRKIHTRFQKKPKYLIFRLGEHIGKNYF